MSIKLKNGFVIDAQGRLLGPGSNLEHLSNDLLQSLIAAGRTEGEAPAKVKAVEVDAANDVDVLADIDTSDVIDELPEVDIEEAVEAAPAKPKTSSRKSSNKSK